MWTIQLLGGLSIRNDTRVLTRFRTQKSASLLAYLAYHSGPATPPHAREMLINMLWPEADVEAGRGYISNALSILRHMLEPPGVPPGSVLTATRQNIHLNPATFVTDAAEFERLIQSVPETPGNDRLAHLLKAVDAYHGTLLPGYYDDWIPAAQVRLESLFLHAARQVVPLLLQANMPDRAVPIAQRAAAADPTDETLTYNLMAAFAAMGNPSMAAQEYVRFQNVLRDELGETPSETLRSFYSKLSQSNHRAIAADDELAGAAQALKNGTDFQRDVIRAPAEPVGIENRLRGDEFAFLTTTRFFGRDEEINKLTSMLYTPRTRLVTVTGMGGTGKTRLALEAAARIVEQPGGKCVEEPSPLAQALFVSLAELHDASDLFDHILRALGSTPGSGADLIGQLASVLKDEPPMLLVLDNFEHLVETGAVKLNELLARAPQVKCLVTSRQALKLHGEREFHLAPLPTSHGARSVTALMEVPSAALFLDRAQAVRPDFQLTTHNMKTVAELCDDLEGIPLAIELAAARLQILSVTKIHEQILEGRLDFLTARARDAGTRHRTLRATLDWSYRMLPPVTQEFFARLAVFRGGWTLDAALSLCQVHSQTDALDLLASLRDNSLIGVSDDDQGLRYSLLETVREYAGDQLVQLGLRDEQIRRHCCFYLQLAETAAPHLSGAEQRFWFERLEAENANLRAALDWCLMRSPKATSQVPEERRTESDPDDDLQRYDIALRFCSALWRFWDARGFWQEGRDRMEAALRLPFTGEPTTRANILNQLGNLSRAQGDGEGAIPFYEESLHIRRELGDKRAVAGSLNNIGTAMLDRGLLAEAQNYLEQALEINREIGNRSWEAANLNNLGRIADRQSRTDDAKSYFEQSLIINRDTNQRNWEADDLMCLGELARQQGRFPEARQFLADAVVLAREIGDRAIEADIVDIAGAVALDEGDYETAASHLDHALVLHRNSGAKISEIRALRMLGTAARAKGNHDHAATYLEQALVISQAIREPAFESHILIEMGLLAVARQNQGEMRRLYEKAMDMFRQFGPGRHPSEPLEITADYLEALICLCSDASPSARCVHLGASIDAQRRKVGKPIPTANIERWNGALARLRSALGDSVFDQAWAEGSATPMEQAIDDARR